METNIAEFLVLEENSVDLSYGGMMDYILSSFRWRSDLCLFLHVP